jgi:hypothetical protein
MKKDKNAAPAAAWRPTLRWHLKTLGGIYLALILFYAALTAFLSRVPPPYKLRDIPQEVTPWLKK